MTPRPTDLVVTPAGLRFLGRRFPCSLGRGGITGDKREGDGATPAGTHRIVGMLYRPDRIAKPADWAVPIRPRDIWSDDPADPDTCHEHQDAGSCVQAGCHLIEFPGFRLTEGVCESTMATVCLARGTGYEESNNPTRRPYYRDDVAMLSPREFTGWSSCDDETPVCTCLDD